ncbi:hypothetical protein [Nonomuraea sp. NPDC049625]|uniref:hypothetical protein n=1 Tax=Nonomuraea sp. NPDC049625 TaxID=3155775 RepID=UPI00342984A1
MTRRGQVRAAISAGMRGQPRSSQSVATPRSAPAVNAAGTSWGMSAEESLSGAAPAFRRRR